MTEKLQVYKCEVCGNVVEVLVLGGGDLVCCGKLMTAMQPKTADQGKEKHVPVIEKGAEGQVVVKVGSIAHPMEDKHFIQWIEVITKSGKIRKFLNPGDKPEATFCVCEDIIEVREYCNLHGLWSAK